MTKIDKSELEEIEYLEKQLSQKLGVYKKFKNSEKNERYFDNLYYKAMRKLKVKNSKTFFSLNPAISYAMLFIISFAVSFLFIDFNNDVSLNDESFLFSETSLWLEEESFIYSVTDEELNLDYSNYFSNEINYAGSSYLNDELIQLSESEFDEIYKNLKLKKIL